MKSYLTLASKYLAMHTKKTRFIIASIAISVALVTGVFSMLDVFLQFEKVQVIHDYGNYHLAVINPTEKEISYIKSRIDVQNSGIWKDLGDGLINGVSCKLGAIDQAFAGNMNIEVIEGKYPTKKNEIMLEKWAAESIGDTVQISFPNNVKKEFIVSGIYNDIGSTKAAGVPGVLLSIKAADRAAYEERELYLVEFKSRVNINKAVEDIKSTLNISDERIGLNNHLLAVMGQSKHKGAIGLYTTGAVLFCIVLAAGVVMIYNTFNISVMERVRQYGLLRCVGASQSQVKKLVKREGLIVTVKAVPLGVLAGILITFFCSAVLKFYNEYLFADIPLFSISLIGITAGVVVGFLTVFIALLLPAKKAAGVSPVNAVRGSDDIKILKRKKHSFLTKTLPVELSMGINNALLNKKTLFLMSCSIAISIIMFLGFNVFVDFMYTSLKTTKPYTPDISLISEQGIDDELHAELNRLDGVKNVYGRMMSYVNATFDASRLTDSYKKNIKDITIKKNGLFVPPEKSWLISYDEKQFKWAKDDLIAGELSEEILDEKNGVIAVAKNLRDNISTETANLQLGDKIYIDTPNGVKELTVAGILRSVPFSSEQLTITTFITTEKLFREITGQSRYKAVDIQLKNKKDEETVNSIKALVDDDISLRDMRQKNAENNQTFLTMAVFIYGFVALIALISILNIINTMNTSVAAKTRYIGVIRAIGMSGRQLNKMILAEALTYTLTGCAAGCVLGIMLQKALIENYLSSLHVIWEFPWLQVILIVTLAFLITILSVISPLKRIRSKGVSEVINSL